MSTLVTIYGNLLTFIEEIDWVVVKTTRTILLVCESYTPSVELIKKASMFTIDTRTHFVKTLLYFCYTLLCVRAFDCMRFVYNSILR